MIEVKHLMKSFHGTPVLTDVCAAIEKGEIISIIGPSGTGKSTFLRCLNLLEHPDAGEIIVDETNVLAKNADIPHLRMKMGMVFQQFNLFPHLTVLENIMLAPRRLRKKSVVEAREQAMKLLELVGLSGKADAFPTELSGGQQQRVAIARTLAMNPEIILFDEPTSALDPTMVNEVLSVIRNLAKTGITMLIVTHEMRFARDVSTRVFYMDEGVIYEDGSARELFDHPRSPKTRAFLRRIGMLNLDLKRSEFDLYHFQSQIDAELEMGCTIQTSVLPLDFPDNDSFRLAAAMFTAKEVGGDFYDFFPIDSTHFAALIADVSGKGITAALYMITTKTLLKELIQSGKKPEEAFHLANQELCRNNRAHMFLTAFLAVLDRKTGVLACVNAGHNPPLLKRGGGTWEYLRVRHSVVLGISKKTVYTSVPIPLNPGDRLFLYTDGVTEAMNANHKQFGEERLQNALNTADETAGALVEHIRTVIEAYAGDTPQSDDITMLLLDFLAADGVPETAAETKHSTTKNSI